jgi:hypothetical protein
MMSLKIHESGAGLLGKPVVALDGAGRLWVGTLLDAGELTVALGQPRMFGVPDGKDFDEAAARMALLGEVWGHPRDHGPFPAAHVADVCYVLGFHEESGAYGRLMDALAAGGYEEDPDGAGCGVD